MHRCLMPSNRHNSLNNFDSNCRTLSNVILKGTPKRDIHRDRRKEGRGNGCRFHIDDGNGFGPTRMPMCMCSNRPANSLNVPAGENTCRATLRR